MTSVRLTTFGGLALARDGAPVPEQRRRLALLAILAAALERGATRDVIIAHLWGDSTEERARHSLDQALTELRKSYGRDVVVRAGAGLRLNGEIVGSDVADLVDAARHGRWEEVVRLYGGPFLDGVHLGDGIELEEWIEGERRRHARTYEEALAALARGASARGDHADAVRWWQQLLSTDPLRGLVVSELMKALAAAGDRAAALLRYREYEQHLRREVGSAPDSELATFAARLRDDGAPATDRRSARAAAGDRLVGALRELLRHAYLIDGPVARGGVTFTVAARDRATLAPVQIKVVRPDLVLMTRPAELVRGLRALVELRHPNLVPVLDAGQADELVWVAAATPGGETLRDRLARERQLPLRDALAIGAAVCGALSVAHRRGVLHLDLAARRVFLDADGARVAEIGLLQAVQASHAGSEGDTITVRVTDYTSPEMMFGDPVIDARSDVYGVACLVYHALTGQVPSAWGAGSTQAAAMQRATSRVAPIGELRDGLPTGLERLLMAGLARSAADRPTLDELCAAFAARD
jgi:serine/threonine-protein kinase